MGSKGHDLRRQTPNVVLTEEGGLWVKKIFLIKWRKMTFDDTK
jgi:hypothetical protein